MADSDTSTADTAAVPAHTHDLEDIRWPVPDGELEHDVPPDTVPPDTDGSRARHPATSASAQHRATAAVRSNPTTAKVAAALARRPS